MTKEQLEQIKARHAAAMVNYPYQDAVVDDIPALVVEVERLNERIVTLQEIITGHNPNLNPNLEQENPYSNEAAKNGITNGDKIREMTNRELSALLIAENACEFCSWERRSDECKINYCDVGVSNWLRQPAKEE